MSKFVNNPHPIIPHKPIQIHTPTLLNRITTHPLPHLRITPPIAVIQPPRPRLDGPSREFRIVDLVLLIGLAPRFERVALFADVPFVAFSHRLLTANGRPPTETPQTSGRRKIGRFNFVDGTGHLCEQHGIVGILPVDELSGEIFHSAEAVVRPPSPQSGTPSPAWRASLRWRSSKVRKCVACK